MTQLPGPAFDGLYGDLILEHFRNPRNRQPVGIAHIEAHELNPFCGDRVDLQIQLDESGRVHWICALSEGCSIIQASTSMMSDALKGRTLYEIDGLAERFRGMMQDRSKERGGGSETSGSALFYAQSSDAHSSDLDALAVVREYPVRIKCALLPWTALEIGLADYRARLP